MGVRSLSEGFGGSRCLARGPGCISWHYPGRNPVNFYTVSGLLMGSSQRGPLAFQALKLAQPDIDLLVMEQQLQDYEDTQMLAPDSVKEDPSRAHHLGRRCTVKGCIYGFKGLQYLEFDVRSRLPC